MADVDLERLERERQDADRKYNDALTAFDASLLRSSPTAPPSAPPGAPLPDAPGGWRGWWLQPVRRWLMPWLEAQHRFNTRAAAAHMLTRRMSELGAPQPAAALAMSSGGTTAAGGAAAPADDYKYVAFEDQFRGSVDDVRAKLGPYLPLFDGASNVLDVGCGRGEFLALLRSAGVSARGVDVNSEMIAEARERGLDAEVADALAYLQSQSDESIGGIFAAQVVEHLEPS